MSDRGGALGELLYAGSSQLFSDLGSHIIFLFLVTGGVLLLTGASIAGVVARTRDGVSATTQAVRRSTSELTAVLREPAPKPQRMPRQDGPPEPPGVEPVVHATHVEAPALDAESRYPDLFEDKDPSPTGATSRARGGAAGRGDRGRRAGRARRGRGGARGHRRGEPRARPGAS